MASQVNLEDSPLATRRQSHILQRSHNMATATVTPTEDGIESLRERKPAKGSTPLAVRIQIPTVDRARLWPQTERVLEYQRRWERIKKQLPPQFSRKHSKVSKSLLSQVRALPD